MTYAALQDAIHQAMLDTSPPPVDLGPLLTECRTCYGADHCCPVCHGAGWWRAT